MTLKEQVETILKECPKGRNSDQWLTIKIWSHFYASRIKEIDGVKYLALKDIMDLPREDNVKRIRAVFQNVLYKYLPTEEKVAKQRKLNIEKWRKLLKDFNQQELVL